MNNYCRLLISLKIVIKKNYWIKNIIVLLTESVWKIILRLIRFTSSATIYDILKICIVCRSTIIIFTLWILNYRFYYCWDVNPIIIRTIFRIISHIILPCTVCQIITLRNIWKRAISSVSLIFNSCVVLSLIRLWFRCIIIWICSVCRRLSLIGSLIRWWLSRIRWWFSLIGSWIRWWLSRIRWRLSLIGCSISRRLSLIRWIFRRRLILIICADCNWVSICTIFISFILRNASSSCWHQI